MFNDTLVFGTVIFELFNCNVFTNFKNLDVSANPLFGINLIQSLI